MTAEKLQLIYRPTAHGSSNNLVLKTQPPGMGVAVGLTVGVVLAVGEGVTVGVAVAVGVTVGVGETVGVTVAVAVGVAVAVAVAVAGWGGLPWESALALLPRKEEATCRRSLSPVPMLPQIG